MKVEKRIINKLKPGVVFLLAICVLGCIQQKIITTKEENIRMTFSFRDTIISEKFSDLIQIHYNEKS